MPPERLFYFDVKDGWEPLCKILNVPVPDVPFPHTNDSKAMTDMGKMMMRKSLIRWAEIIATVGVVGVAAWLYVPKEILAVPGGMLSSALRG